MTATGEAEKRLLTFEDHRKRLFSLAYRMLGTASDAEDLVQETYLRWQSVDEEVHNPRAYLTTVITRLAINQLGLARVQREQYIGQWLPEPVATEEADPSREVDRAESISMAFLVMLETLGPVERAVLLLRDVFDYEYDEISHMVGKSEANCRQLLRRARQHIAERKPRFAVDRQQSLSMTQRFLAAISGGDPAQLFALLAEDAVLYTDGGGKVAAAINPIYGADKIARFLTATTAKLDPAEISVQIQELNGQPGVIVSRSCGPDSVVILDVANDRIQTVYIVRNPDKLMAVSR